VDRCELLELVGSTNSNNSIPMVEVARKLGVRAELVADVTEFDPRGRPGTQSL